MRPHTFKKSGIDARLFRRDPSYALVVDFQNSVPPAVWYCDLEKSASFSVVLRGSGDDWTLGLTTEKGDFTPIAHFDNREDAVDAFDAVHDNLMKRAKKSYSRLWHGILVAVLVIALVLMAKTAVTALWPDVEQTPLTEGNNPATVTKPAPERTRTNVPLPADEVLLGQ